MDRRRVKKQTDQQIITRWIEPNSRVLDLGCGRGVLLEELIRLRKIHGVGVDSDPQKIASAIKRGLNIFQGDMMAFISEMPDHHYDWIILSRTIQELTQPGRVIKEALRIGQNVVVAFVNHGYWRNRLSVAQSGSRVTNEVFPLSWDEGSPYNPVTIDGFEEFCAKSQLEIADTVYLRADWHTQCELWPNLRAGYVLYHLKLP